MHNCTVQKLKSINPTYKTYKKKQVVYLSYHICTNKLFYISADNTYTLLNMSAKPT